MTKKNKTGEEYAAEEVAFVSTLKTYANGLSVSNEEFEAFSESKKLIFLSDFMLRKISSVRNLLLKVKKDDTAETVKTVTPAKEGKKMNTMYQNMNAIPRTGNLQFRFTGPDAWPVGLTLRRYMVKQARIS